MFTLLNNDTEIFLSYIEELIIRRNNGNNLLNKSYKIFGSLYDLEIKDFDDFIPYLVIGIILGGRLGYVLIYNFDYYIKNLHEIFYVWNGGMSFHGGLIGIIVATFIFTSIKKIHTFIYLDIISCVAPIGLFLGRISNFINGELYGKATDLPWGVIFPTVGTFARHPSQIYEAILEGLLLFIILNFLAFRRKLIFKQGLISIYFLFFYSVFRFFSETFREPDEQLGYLIYSLTMGQLLSLTMILFGVVIYFRLK